MYGTVYFTCRHDPLCCREPRGPCPHTSISWRRARTALLPIPGVQDRNLRVYPNIHSWPVNFYRLWASAKWLHCSKRFTTFPSPARMQLFPARESLVSGIPAEDGKIDTVYSLKYRSRILAPRNIRNWSRINCTALKKASGDMSMLPEEVVSPYGNETPSMERWGVRSRLLFVSNVLHLVSGLLQHRKALHCTVH